MRKNFVGFLRITILTILLAIIGLPIIYMIVTSFTSTNTSGVTTFTPSAYSYIFENAPVMQWTGNTLFLSITKTVLQMTLAILSAFTFVHLDFKGKNVIFYCIIMMMMVPHQLLMMPLYFTVDLFGWVNSFIGAIIPQLLAAHFIFVLRQSFFKVPKELAQAGEVEGCNFWQILFYIYIPVSKPAIVSTLILAFAGNWNEYNWSLLILKDNTNFTLPVATSYFNDGINYDIPQIMAVATIIVVPLIVIYMFFQRQIVENYANSGIK